MVTPVLLLMAALFSTAAFAARTPLQMAIEPVDCDQELTQRQDYRQKIRASFLARFLPASESTPEKNLQVIELALQKNPGHRFVLKENAVMKFLNTVNDKDLVTALTNFHNFLYMQAFKAAFPEGGYKVYADFKGLLIAIPEPVGAVLDAKLDAVMKEADRRFYQSAVLSQIVRRGDLGNVMFKSALGSRDVMAVWIAHLARKSGANFLSESDPEVMRVLNAGLSRFKALHSELIRAFKDTAISVNGETMDLGVFAAARKIAEPGELLMELRRAYPQTEIGAAQVAAIQEYVELANSFSPNLLIERRGEISIQDSPFGAISLDFLGLGAENLHATALALSEASDLMDAAWRVRVHERRVTASFEARKAAVRATIEKYALELVEDRRGGGTGPAVEINISGDDGYIRILRKLIPGSQLRLLSALSDLFATPYLRMTSIDESIATADVSEAIGHGENIEKHLRQLIRERVSVPFANAMQIGLFITAAGENRHVFLNLNFYQTSMRGRTIARSFTESEKAAIRQAFADAVAKVQTSISGPGPVYHPNETVFGRHSRIRDRFHGVQI